MTKAKLTEPPLFAGLHLDPKSPESKLLDSDYDFFFSVFQYTISGASAYLMRLLPQCNLKLRRIQPSVTMTDCASSWRFTVGSGNISLPPEATLILL